MSRKALLIAPAVVVLALGAIGAAFATGIEFSNIGALSSGTGDIPQVNTTYVGYVTCGAIDHVKVVKVVAAFDRDLGKGSQIYAGVMSTDGDYVAKGCTVLLCHREAGEKICIPMNQYSAWVDPEDIGEIRVAVAQL